MSQLAQLLVVAFVPALTVVLATFALNRQSDQVASEMRYLIEALRRRIGADVRAAVAVLSAGSRAPMSSRRARSVAQEWREVSGHVRALALAAAQGLKESKEATEELRRALEGLTAISGSDSPALLTVVITRADHVTLEWLADELAVRAAEFEAAT
jgi:hypothetical protein